MPPPSPCRLVRLHLLHPLKAGPDCNPLCDIAHCCGEFPHAQELLWGDSTRAGGKSSLSCRTLSLTVTTLRSKMCYVNSAYEEGADVFTKPWSQAPFFILVPGFFLPFPNKKFSKALICHLLFLESPWRCC